MKKYDRQQKKWVEESELTRKHKKREKCKGGREHDYVLTLPSYQAEATPEYKGRADLFYKAQEEIRQFEDAAYAKLEKHGILVKNHRFSRGMVKEYTCSVCLKAKYDYNS